MMVQSEGVQLIATGEAALRQWAEWAFARVKSGEIIPPTEAMIVTQTLSLANLDDSTDGQVVKELYMWFIFGIAGQPANQHPLIKEAVKEQSQRNRDAWEKILGLDSIKRDLMVVRDAIRGPLEHALKNLKAARLRHAAQVSEWLAKLEFRGVPRFERSTLSYAQALLSTPITSASSGGQNIPFEIILPRAGWAIALLLDKNRQFGRHLRQCALSGCSNLFLVLPSQEGGRPSRYCSPSHQNEARRVLAAHRSQRYRVNMSAKHK
jgi:hypothetical protein